MTTTPYGNGCSMRLYVFMFYYGYVLLALAYFFELYTFAVAIVDMGGVDTMADFFLYYSLDLLFKLPKGILIYRLYSAKHKYHYELFTQSLMFIYVISLISLFTSDVALWIMYGYSLDWLSGLLSSILLTLCIHLPIYHYLNKRLTTPIKRFKDLWGRFIDTLMPKQLEEI